MENKYNYWILILKLSNKEINNECEEDETYLPGNYQKEGRGKKALSTF